MFEIDDIVTESSYETMIAMLCAYEKALVLESYGLHLKDNDDIFQESKTPERKTTLEKVIWFIPDMIRKFIEFIKNKLNKLFGKKPTEIISNIKGTITGSKDDDSKKKKIVAALAAVGLTAAATATGYVIYDKHKTKVLTFEADDSDVIGVTIVYDIPNMIKSLESSVDVSTDLMKLSSTSNSSAYEKQYKSIIKKLKNATKSLDEAVKPNTTMNTGETDGKVYTIQQLMKELKQLSDSIDKVDRSIKVSRDRSFSNKSDKYKEASQELNEEISNWVNAFQTFMTKTSAFISNMNSAIEAFSSHSFYMDGGADKYNFAYLSSLITYCSYENSEHGFWMSAINDPWQKSNKIEPSQREFNSLGQISKIIRNCFENNVIRKPVWGHVGNEWFVLTPEFHNKDVKGTSGHVHRETNEHYGFVFKSDEEFSKTAQFIRNSSNAVLVECMRHMMTPTRSTDENYSGLLIDRDVLSKFMYTTQRSATGLSKDLQPADGEIFFNVTANSNVQDIRDALKSAIKDEFDVVSVKTPGVMKIRISQKSKGGQDSSTPPISKEDALRIMDILESLDELNNPDRNEKGD